MPDKSFQKIEMLAGKIVRMAGASYVLVMITLLLLAWIIFGYLFGFSPLWESSMTVPATVITFMLVFLILRAQNKDTRAMQLKLNEIIGALSGANNELIDIENKSEQSLQEFHQRYETVADHILEIDGLVTDTIIIHKIAEEIKVAEGSSNIFGD